MSLRQIGFDASMTAPVLPTGASDTHIAEVGENSALERSSEASLLDSCEGEEDEEGADSTSIQACASEDYTPYVDETGQLRDKTAPEETASTKTFTVNGNKRDTPKSNVLHNETKRTSSVDRELPGNTIRREVSLSPPQLDGLAFDLNQPWERSLLRQLENDAQMLPATTHPRTMMLLGHTESRDFAIEYDPKNDDNVSLETSSSCPPQRMQFIHRPAYLPSEPRVVYRIPPSNHDDDEYYDNYAASSRMQLQQTRYNQHQANRLSKGDIPPPTTSSLTSVTNVNVDGRDDDLVPVFIPPHQYKFLEMEVSTGHSYNEGQNDLNIPDLVHHTAPDPGCFCLGYDMLEYVLSPPVQPRVLKRNVGVLRPARLPRVDEVGTTALDAMAIPEIIDVSTTINKKNAKSREKSVEPEGSYFMAAENSYTTATEYYTPSSPKWTAKRQGIER
jgi:hypothetical protein